VAVEADLRSVVADVVDDLARQRLDVDPGVRRDLAGDDRGPVFTIVSQATRARLSCARMASSTASEIWSAILSGWPSETDSEVKR
jgi:hypothetical protein